MEDTTDLILPHSPATHDPLITEIHSANKLNGKVKDTLTKELLNSLPKKDSTNTVLIVGTKVGFTAEILATQC